VVNERDGYGDELVPDYLTQVHQGDFYGWPYAYVGPHPDPDFGDERPDLVALTRAPDVLFEAHSAPIGLAFYDADQFPAAYRGGAFVSHRGSWNSNRPTGYRVVFVPFVNEHPQNRYQVFATGFRRAGTGGEGERAEVWGRPAGLAVAADGSLLIADDTGGTIWRVAYTGE
jgi:glucose/arabinose dehydrogenase